MYLYIKAAKLIVTREQLSPRPLAAEVDNLEVVKGFHTLGVHNIFVCNQKFVDNNDKKCKRQSYKETDFYQILK
jgi:hypothetical protein